MTLSFGQDVAKCWGNPRHARPMFRGEVSVDRQSIRKAHADVAIAAFPEEFREFAPSPDTSQPEADRYADAVETGLKPYQATIENDLDDEVRLRFFSSHVHRPGWNDDFVGDDVAITRSDEPDREPEIIPRHMPEQPHDFWPKVIEAAKGWNRPKR